MSTLYDIDAFFRGYKPALLYNPNSTFFTYTDEEMEQLSKYPYMPLVVHEMDQNLYFQSTEIKEQFQSDISDLKVDSLKYHNEIGLILGFPPKAVHFYSNRLRMDDFHDWERVCFDYCGIGCVGNIEDIEENVQWLWSLPIPDEEFRTVTIGFSTGEPSLNFYIPYGAKIQLQRAQDEIILISKNRKALADANALCS